MVELAQLGMASVKSQVGFREAMLTRPLLGRKRRRKRKRRRRSRGGLLFAKNWTVVNVRHTVSLRRSCSGRSRTWAASYAAGPADTTP